MSGIYCGHDPSPNRCTALTSYGDGYHEPLRCMLDKGHKDIHMLLIAWNDGVYTEHIEFDGENDDEGIADSEYYDDELD